MHAADGSFELLIVEREDNDVEDIQNRSELVRTLNPRPYETDRCYAFDYSTRNPTTTAADLRLDLFSSLEHLNDVDLLSALGAAVSICAKRETGSGWRGNINSILLCPRDQTVWIGASREQYTQLDDTSICGRLVRYLGEMSPALKMLKHFLRSVESAPTNEEEQAEVRVLQREKERIEEMLGLIQSLHMEQSEAAVGVLDPSAYSAETDVEQDDAELQILQAEARRLDELLAYLNASDPPPDSSPAFFCPNGSCHTDAEPPSSSDTAEALPAIGEIVCGTVTRIKKKIAFVDCGEYQAILPVREITWDHIANPAKTLKDLSNKGTIQAKVIGHHGKRIVLSLRQLTPNPYAILSRDSIIDVEIERINKNGGFASVVNTTAIGHIPLSEMPNWMAKGRQKASQRGNRYKARILRVDGENGKLKLSLLKAGKGVRPAPASQLVQ